MGKGFWFASSFIAGVSIALPLACGDSTPTSVEEDAGPDSASVVSPEGSVTNDSGGGDAGRDVAALPDADDSGTGGDGGPINGCTNFTDRSDPNDQRRIQFPNNAAPQQYQPRCLQIKAGQSVTWEGSFSNHPLVATPGVPSNPIPSTPVNTGTAYSITFPAAGTFGYECSAHPAQMNGALRVVP
jgi:plastocyanin